VGSAATLLLLWLLALPLAGRLGFLVAATAAGFWSAGRAETLLGGKDPGAIVIDEVAGMALAVVLVPPTPWPLAAGFVLFRLFDVVKPFPAGAVQRAPGAVGVMVDDLVAGAYAAAGLALLDRVLG
jgi:phosphatidylglycerophosphatase A